MADGDFPERYRHRWQATKLYGELADRYADQYLRADPVADALVDWLRAGPKEHAEQFERALRLGVASVPDASPELQAFFESIESIPPWVDFAQIERGAFAYQRFGLVGMIILSAWSLLNGYHSSAA
ncbi:MAG: hypothetical protein AAF997_24585, partial [Myxococcota bacterium]